MFAGPMRSLLRDVKGSALVEGALLIPVLFVLMYGVYDFSWFFYQQQLVSTRFAESSLGFFGLLRLSVPVISMSHSQRVIGPG